MPFLERNDELRETLVDVEAVPLELLDPVSSDDDDELEDPEVVEEDVVDAPEELDVLLDVALHDRFLSLEDLLVCGLVWCLL